jgi:hypothetical protein
LSWFSGYQAIKLQRRRLIDLLHYFQLSEVTIEGGRYFALISAAEFLALRF